MAELEPKSNVSEIETLRASLAIERERNKILMTQITYARQALQLALKMLGTNPNDVVTHPKIQDLADPSSW